MSTATHPSDDQLVEQTLAGEAEAFAEIVGRYEAEVWKVVCAVVRDRAATENLVQQSFVNAYERLGQFRIGHDLVRWLKGIARNLAIDELRKMARESRCLSHYRDYVIASSEDEERAVERARRLEVAVAQCADRLGPAASRALALRYDDALSVEEVATALGRSLAATRQLLFRAREAIRQCVDQRLAVE